MTRLHRLVDRARGAPWWARFCGTTLLVLAALGARCALGGPEPGHAFLTFFAAVLLAAVLFGRWLGLPRDSRQHRCRGLVLRPADRQHAG